MKLVHQDEHALYVHGGFVPYLALDRQDPWDILWERKAFLFADKRAFRAWPLIVHGHTPVMSDPLYKNSLETDKTKPRKPWRINVDGGTYKTNGEIRAVILPEMRILRVRVER